ncbi:MAG: hypothetical protein ACRD8Z_13675 [Nitrososphaeraceae archaeon]
MKNRGLILKEISVTALSLSLPSLSLSLPSSSLLSTSSAQLNQPLEGRRVESV